MTSGGSNGKRPSNVAAGGKGRFACSAGRKERPGGEDRCRVGSLAAGAAAPCSAQVEAIARRRVGRVRQPVVVRVLVVSSRFGRGEGGVERMNCGEFLFDRVAAR
jgi:hypothetical protein